MNASAHLSFLQLRSLAKKSGEMELSLQTTSIPAPGRRMRSSFGFEAAPINPSDLGLLLANADWSQAKAIRHAATAGADGAVERQCRAGHGGAHRYLHAGRQ